MTDYSNFAKKMILKLDPFKHQKIGLKLIYVLVDHLIYFKYDNTKPWELYNSDASLQLTLGRQTIKDNLNYNPSGYIELKLFLEIKNPVPTPFKIPFVLSVKYQQSAGNCFLVKLEQQSANSSYVGIQTLSFIEDTEGSSYKIENIGDFYILFFEMLEYFISVMTDQQSFEVIKNLHIK